MSGTTGPVLPVRRLDQWLWFARFAKSRSFAARLCTEGAVAVNGAVVKKPNHALRLGDTVRLTLGPWQRDVRITGLGMRRGPAGEARLLYDEIDPTQRRPVAVAEWEPLLAED